MVHAIVESMSAVAFVPMQFVPVAPVHEHLAEDNRRQCYHWRHCSLDCQAFVAYVDAMNLV